MSDDNKNQSKQNPIISAFAVKKLAPMVIPALTPLIPIILVFICTFSLIIGFSFIFISSNNTSSDNVKDIFTGTNICSPDCPKDLNVITITALKWMTDRIGACYSQTKRDGNPCWDCSSSVRDAYSESFKRYKVDYFIGSTTVNQYEQVPDPQTKIPWNKQESDLSVGDLVYLKKGNNNSHHVFMYAGDGKVIEERNPSKGLGLTQSLSWYLSRNDIAPYIIRPSLNQQAQNAINENGIPNIENNEEIYKAVCDDLTANKKIDNFAISFNSLNAAYSCQKGIIKTKALNTILIPLFISVLQNAPTTTVSERKQKSLLEKKIQKILETDDQNLLNEILEKIDKDNLANYILNPINEISNNSNISLDTKDIFSTLLNYESQSEFALNFPSTIDGTTILKLLKNHDKDLTYGLSEFNSSYYITDIKKIDNIFLARQLGQITKNDNKIGLSLGIIGNTKDNTKDNINYLCKQMAISFNKALDKVDGNQK